MANNLSDRKRISPFSASLILSSLFLVLGWVVPVILPDFFVRFGLLREVFDDYGHLVTTEPTHLIIVVIVIVVAIIGLFALFMKKERDRQNHQALLQAIRANEQNRRRRISHEMNLMGINLAKSRAENQSQRVKGCLMGKSEWPEIYTDPNRLMFGIVETLKKVIHKALRDEQHKIPESDISISVPYLLNPSKNKQEWFLEGSGWRCFHNAKDRFKKEELTKITVYNEEEGRRSSMMVSLLSNDFTPYYATKKFAHNKKEYVFVKSDEDGLHGSIYCHPIRMELEDRLLFIASVNISTHKNTFARNDEVKKNEIAKELLEAIVLSVENQIKTELLNIYISACQNKVGITGDETKEEKIEEIIKSAVNQIVAVVDKG